MTQVPAQSTWPVPHLPPYACAHTPLTQLEPLLHGWLQRPQWNGFVNVLKHPVPQRVGYAEGHCAGPVSVPTSFAVAASATAASRTAVSVPASERRPVSAGA